MTNNEIFQSLCSIHKKINKLDEAIRGNGEPGLKEEIRRLKQWRQSRRRLVWGVAIPALLAFIAGFAGALAGLLC